ncbi:hypothetical protein ITP53_52990 [Nonomuraea sp. K274]|uniref:Uncharacterized protein n=1 Tax=Nonomuraea cypriaca TaxID=1187855 RepID=A0A931F620_9ACTN|nr:hypothetical protein [Nonomuraea cypriaca]MBF8194242.1 hypothetical protein [Nonomuraea cypriaca]
MRSEFVILRVQHLPPFEPANANISHICLHCDLIGKAETAEHACAGKSGDLADPPGRHQPPGGA